MNELLNKLCNLDTKPGICSPGIVLIKAIRVRFPELSLLQTKIIYDYVLETVKELGELKKLKKGLPACACSRVRGLVVRSGLVLVRRLACVSLSRVTPLEPWNSGPILAFSLPLEGRFQCRTGIFPGSQEALRDLKAKRV